MSVARPTFSKRDGQLGLGAALTADLEFSGDQNEVLHSLENENQAKAKEPKPQKHLQPAQAKSGTWASDPNLN